MRVAWCSSLSSCSLSGWYTSKLVALLKTEWEITLFTDDQDLLLANSWQVPVRHYLQIPLLQSEKDFDLFIHLFEDSNSSHFALYTMSLYPGVALVFDREFRKPGLENYPQRVKILDALSQSELIIGFNEHSIKSESDKVALTYLPLELGPPKDVVSEPKIIGFAGTTSISERGSYAERAFQELAEQFPLKLHLIKSDNAHDLIDEISQVDIFWGNETSLTRSLPLPLLLALSNGIPTIVTEHGIFSELPSAVAIKVQPVRTEVRELVEVTALLISDYTKRSTLAKQAREYIATVHNPNLIKQDLLQAVERNYGNIKKRFELRGQQYSSEVNQLINDFMTL
jgi:hypothetical protein